MEKEPFKPAAKRRIVLVQWKDKYKTIEVFSNLKNFCDSYADYNYHTLNSHLSKGKKYYENEKVRVERKILMVHSKPDFPKRFFWDFDYEQMDWKGGYVTIIQRIIERGAESNWGELIRFYGRDHVVDTLKSKINFLPDEIIEKVCQYFKLKKAELKCYTRKQSQPIRWR